MIQGSEEWFAARCGRATGSRIADIVAKTRSGWGASRANYEAELIAERLSGVPADSWQSPAMRWGIETEPQARAAYEFVTDVDVELVAFVPHPTIEDSGASPDGLVLTDGLVEFKCPNTATHIATLLGAKVPAKYITQVQWQMACTGRRWCDWCSFDPRMPESMRLYMERIQRDDAMIAELEREVVAFLDGVTEKVEALEAKYEREAA